MGSLVKMAKADYNATIEGIKEAAKEKVIDTIVSVIQCGIGWQAKNVFETINSSANSLKPLEDYEATGGSTPLFDSVLELIEQLKKVPDAEEKDVAFLIMVITDGQDNYSRKINGSQLGDMIRKLQATDKWTFTFRVPYGYKKSLVDMGIPANNILEWEQTSKGFEAATGQTVSATRSYYGIRAAGQTATANFYSNLNDVKQAEVKKALNDITKEVQFFDIKKTSPIREFVEHKVGTYRVGTAFYQLNKPEKVQGNKKFVIRDRVTGKVYTGEEARDLMGLPKGGEIKLYPGKHGAFDVFIQSTSTNRKLVPYTELLYWRNA
jgi:hypothetical protein